MGTWRKNRRQGLRQLAAFVVLGTVGLTGCGQKAEQEAAKPAEAPAQVAAATPTPAELPPPPSDGRHQPFDKATRRADDPPEECNRPPDTTVSGKPVFKLYNEVVRLWDTIRYVTPAGKRVVYSATIETDLGDIEIELHPEWAPNHVRNFVALARAGYYDGLFFDRVRHEESEDEAAGPLESIEAGCNLFRRALADIPIRHQIGALHGAKIDRANERHERRDEISVPGTGGRDEKNGVIGRKRALRIREHFETILRDTSVAGKRRNHVDAAPGNGAIHEGRIVRLLLRKTEAIGSFQSCPFWPAEKFQVAAELKTRRQRRKFRDVTNL